MKPLIVLLATFIVAILILKMTHGADDFARSGKIALSAMLIFTAAGHFMYTDGMAMMIPSPVPFKKSLVYITAIIELVAAFTLLIPKYAGMTGWFLMFFFLLVLPANIKASFEFINYQSATYDGYGPGYLWFRVPIQIFYVIWAYLCAVR